VHPQQNRGADIQFAVPDLADDGWLDLQGPAQFRIILQLHPLYQCVQQFVGHKGRWFHFPGTVHRLE
jgi:hypothetical protein